MNFSNFAQATGAPNSGASNAEDFQPPTRNPQSAGGSLQPGAETQTPGGQELLNNPNANISITRNPAEPQTTTQVKPDGFNWVVVVLVTIIIIAIYQYVTRRKNRTVLLDTATASTEALVDAEPEFQEDHVPMQPARVRAEAPKKLAKKSTPKKKSKSKSKRKHK